MSSGLRSLGFGACVAVVALASVAGAGCVIHVAPPPVPEKVMPKLTMQPDPPSEGEGQVVIDTTNGSATVTAILAGLGGNMALTKSICASTPCAANLPTGSYDLVFAGKADPTLASSDAVQVSRTPSVMRHTLGKVESSPGLLWGGLGLVTLGSTGMLVYGLMATSGIEGVSHTGDYIGLGVSTALTAAGAIMMVLGRTKLQPGSSVQWAPDGAIPVDKTSGRSVLYTGNGVRVTW